MMPLTIHRLTGRADESVLDAMCKLLEELGNEQAERGKLARSIEDPQCYCLAGFVDGRLVGTVTGYLGRTPLKGKWMLVEDVIVFEKERGNGFGKKLMKRLIKLATEEGCTMLFLTSRSERRVAHNLYESVGLKVVDTNVFKLML